MVMVSRRMRSPAAGLSGTTAAAGACTWRWVALPCNQAAPVVERLPALLHMRARSGTSLWPTRACGCGSPRWAQTRAAAGRAAGPVFFMSCPMHHAPLLVLLVPEAVRPSVAPLWHGLLAQGVSEAVMPMHRAPFCSSLHVCACSCTCLQGVNKAVILGLVDELLSRKEVNIW